MKTIAKLLICLLFSFLFSRGWIQQVEIVLKEDLDRDGSVDSIVQTKYELPYEPYSDHRVKYTLNYGMDGESVLIFDHSYGGRFWAADYWTISLKIFGDFNKDGTLDLLYTAADDTSEDVVILLQKHGFFKAIYLGQWLIESLELNSSNEIAEVFQGEVFAKWNCDDELFHGTKLRWITKDNVEIRSEPGPKGKMIGKLYKNQVVIAQEQSVFENKGISDWISILTQEGLRGWILNEYVSLTSPSRLFKGVA